MWIILTPLLALSQTPINVCPTYGCHLGGEDWDDTCFKPLNDDYVMQICESTTASYCDLTPSVSSEVKCSGAPERIKDPGYPGEFCLLGSDCLSGTCTDNKCQGNSYGSYCVSHGECQVGAYCGAGGICEPQLGLQASCSSDWDCVNKLACNRTIYEPGKCVPYYSLKAGQSVGMCVTWLSEGMSNLCESGSCKQTTEGVNGEGVCQEAFKIQGVFPKQCYNDKDCVGNNGYYDRYGSCECGMDKNGFAYCNAWSGDLPTAVAREYRKDHLRSIDLDQCHTMTRFSDECMAKTLTPQNFESYRTSHLRAMNVARYTNNDFCTQEILNKDYWKSSSTYNLQCKRYSCAKDSEMTGDVCFTYNQGVNSYYIRNCTQDPEKNFCNIGRAMAREWANTTCSEPPTVPKKYPGELCTVNADCISGTCSLGYCKGILEDKECSVNEECDVGLYCKFNWGENTYNTTCAPLISYGEVGCGVDYECEMNSGCNITASHIPGTCVKYFSVPNGGHVKCSESGISYMCQSGTCYYESGETGICVEAPTLSGTHPQTCVHDSGCIGFSGNYMFKGSCQCGYNNFGYSFCLPFLGDENGQAFIAGAKAALTDTNLKLHCQTTRRYTTDCWMALKTQQPEADAVFVAVKNYTDYSSFLMNEECVQEIITFDYWSKVPNPDPPYDPDDNPDTGSALRLVLTLVAVIGIIN